MKVTVESLRENWRDVLGMRGQRARTALYLLAAGILGLLLMMLGQFAGPGAEPAPAGDDSQREPQAARQLDEPAQLARHETALEARLGEILAQVEGAGRVEVRVRLAEGPRYAYEQDSRINERISEEEDAQGGVRRVQEATEDLQTVFAGGSGGSGDPLVRSVGSTQVEGVLVVSEGAGEAAVRDRLHRAVEVLLGLPLHRVYVVEGEGG